MDTPEIVELIEELEKRIDRLRSLYEQYFMGIEKLEPMVPRKDVDRRFQVLRREQIRNTGVRYKYQMLLQKYNTYQMYWGRIVRRIEAGTYRRGAGGHHTRSVPSLPPSMRPPSLAPGAQAPREKPTGDAAKVPSIFTSNSINAEMDSAFDFVTAIPKAPNVPTFSEKQPSAPGDSIPPGPDGKRPSREERMKLLAQKIRATKELSEAARRSNPPKPGSTPPRDMVPPKRISSLSMQAVRPEKEGFATPTPKSVPPRPDPRPDSKPPPPVQRPYIQTAADRPVARPPAAQVPVMARPAQATRSETNDSISDARVKEIYKQYVDSKRKANESTAAITYDGVAKQLRESTAKLREKNKGKNVDFEVILKDGKTVLKPVVK